MSASLGLSVRARQLPSEEKASKTAKPRCGGACIAAQLPARRFGRKTALHFSEREKD